MKRDFPTESNRSLPMQMVKFDLYFLNKQPYFSTQEK